MLEAIYAEPFSFRWRLLPLLRAEMVEKKLKECVVLTDDEKMTECLQAIPGEEKRFLNTRISTLNLLRAIGTTPSTLAQTNNHAAWCPNCGMEESFQGLTRFVKLFSHTETMAKTAADTPVYRGSTRFITGSNPDAQREASSAVLDLIGRARMHPN